MSDRSGHRSSGSGSASELDYEYEGYRDNRDRYSSVSDPSDHDQQSESEDEEDNKSPVDITNLVLCSQHKPGELSMDCKTCKAALSIIKDKATVNMLIKDGQSGSGYVSRYSGRCDNVNPTLTLASSTLQIARDIFTKGQFKDSKAWADILKKYLTLSTDQHDLLSIDIKTEEVLNKFRREKRFNHVFVFQKDLVGCLKNLRIAQRPLFSLIEKTNDKMTEAKNIAEKCGVVFSQDPPVKSGGNVPRIGRALTDQLHISDYKDVLPRPDINDLCDKARLTEEQAELVVKELEAYRSDVGKSFMELLNSHIEFLSSTEDLLIFYSDLYSHCDGSLRELIRKKVASLFKQDVKSDVLLQSSNKKLTEKPSGLFGGMLTERFLSNTVYFSLYFSIFLYTLFLGDKKIRNLLGESTKKETVLRKAVVPRKSFKKRSSRSSPGRRRSRSRSPRSNSPSSSRKDKGHSSRFQNRKRRGSKGDGGKKDGAKKSKKDSGKSKGIIPDIVTDSWSTVWSTFLSPASILMVTSLGFVTSMLPTMESLPLGGRISNFISNWKRITDNNWVLSVVEFGYKIPLKSSPSQSRVPKNPPAVGNAHDILVQEANDLLNKHAVSFVEPVDGQYISSYFAVPKPRKIDQWRPILNLKYFNDFIKKYRFQMETLASVREWIKPNSYCTSLDLKDAFLHIPIHQQSKKYLRFHWLNKILEWQVLVFGLTCSPRVITKVLKPVVAFLRLTWSILISIYIDDILVQHRDPSTCILHTQIVIIVFMCLGWSFKFEKCDLVPKQEFIHLGFLFNTVDMTISCPPDKIARLQSMCAKVLSTKKCTVLTLEKIIGTEWETEFLEVNTSTYIFIFYSRKSCSHLCLGTIESYRPAVRLAALYYRSLQSQLLSAKRHVRIPNKTIYLSQRSVSELSWWISPEGFETNCSAPIRELEPDLDIWSDANMERGGAHSSRGDYVQRYWSPEELASDPHINLLELRAARESLALARAGDRVRLHLDNKVALYYIRKQGGTRSSILSREACLLWKESIQSDIFLLNPHWLATSDNVSADFLSRHDLGAWEFQLSRPVFSMIMEHFQLFPTLDAFASRDTTQLPRYMTWEYDPRAVARNALIHKWDPITYLFPPVPLVMSSLQKIQQEKLTVVLVVPKWPTALWWPLVQEMMSEPLLPLPKCKSILELRGNCPKLPYLDPLVAVHLQAQT